LEGLRNNNECGTFGKRRRGRPKRGWHDQVETAVRMDSEQIRINNVWASENGIGHCEPDIYIIHRHARTHTRLCIIFIVFVLFITHITFLKVHKGKHIRHYDRYSVHSPQLIDEISG
jgi:hypothetical protein